MPPCRQCVTRFDQQRSQACGTVFRPCCNGSHINWGAHLLHVAGHSVEGGLVLGVPVHCDGPPDHPACKHHFFAKLSCERMQSMLTLSTAIQYSMSTDTITAFKSADPVCRNDPCLAASKNVCERQSFH